MASDPFADYQNMMGMQGLFGQNPYLEYQGQIPMAGYTGVPTNAQGQPIQSYLDWQAANPGGTTLNNTPTQPKATGLTPWQQYQQAVATGQPYTGPSVAASSALSQLQHGVQATPQNLAQLIQNGVGGAQPSTATAQANQPAISQRQAYLNALSNPGQVTTPSAQIYPGAAQTGAPQPSVLNQFLAAHQGGGTTGAGGYTNVPFFNTLNALKAGGSP